MIAKENVMKLTYSSPDMLERTGIHNERNLRQIQCQIPKRVRFEKNLTTHKHVSLYLLRGVPLHPPGRHTAHPAHPLAALHSC